MKFQLIIQKVIMQKKTKDQYYISVGESVMANILLDITFDWAHIIKEAKHVLKKLKKPPVIE